MRPRKAASVPIRGIAEHSSKWLILGAVGRGISMQITRHTMSNKLQRNSLKIKERCSNYSTHFFDMHRGIKENKR
jgi:hypothetical protein